MQFAIDILLVLVFVLMVFKGYRKGFLKTILGLARLVLSFVAAYLFGPSLAGWIDSTFVNPAVFDSVHSQVLEAVGSTTGGVNGFLASIPESLQGFVDSAAFQEQYGNANASVEAMAEDISHTISDAMSIAISTVIGYILMFIIAFIVLSIVIALVGKLAKLPVIKQFDKLLGLVMGLVNGVIAVSLIATLAYAFVYSSGDLSAYENSTVFKFVYDLNFFGFLIDSFM